MTINKHKHCLFFFFWYYFFYSHTKDFLKCCCLNQSIKLFYYLTKLKKVPQSCTRTQAQRFTNKQQSIMGLQSTCWVPDVLWHFFTGWLVERSLRDSADSCDSGWIASSWSTHSSPFWFMYRCAKCSRACAPALWI